MVKLTRRCAICGGRVIRNNILCGNHYREYKNYIHEPWMQELKRMEDRQSVIDDKEIAETDKRLILAESYTPRKHPKTSKDMRARIFIDFDNGMSRTELAKKYKLGYSTIHRMLKNRLTINDL